MSQIEHAGRAQLARPALELELEAIDRQQRRFSRLSLLAIVVSFVHMAAALALFSGAAWYEVGAALAMTALVDVATWALAGYFDYAARRRLARSVWIKATFGFALAISMFLNGAYLYAHRPPTLPGWMSVGIAGAFAVFVPMLIGVASLIRGELEDDRLRLQQHQVSLAPVANVPESGPETSRTQPPRTRPRRGELPAFANATPEGLRTTAATPGVLPLAANDRGASRGSASGVRAPAANNSGELSAFESVTLGSARTTTTPVAPAPAENGQPPQPQQANDVRAHGPFAGEVFVSPLANGAAASSVHGAATVRVRAESGSSSDETPVPPIDANPNRHQAFVNAAPTAFASANASIPTNDVPAIVAALQSANVREFVSARALARVCGWTSSSSGPKALKQLLAAGVVRETAEGFALVESGSEQTPSTRAEPLAPIAI